MTKVEQQSGDKEKPQKPLWYRILKTVLWVVLGIVSVILFVVIMAYMSPAFKGRVMGRATFVVPNGMRPFLIQRLEELNENGVSGLSDILANHSDWTVRFEAADALSIDGPFAEAAIPTLVKAAKSDAEPRVRARAVVALAMVKNTGFDETYLETIKDKDLGVQRETVRAISLMPKISPPLVDPLVELLKNNVDWQTSVLICEEILAKHRASEPKFQSALEAAAKSTDEDVREVAQEVLAATK